MDKTVRAVYLLALHPKADPLYMHVDPKFLQYAVARHNCYNCSQVDKELYEAIMFVNEYYNGCESKDSI